MTAPLRDALAKALDDKGAYCGTCDYESGVCPDCVNVLNLYADAILALLVEHREQVLTHLGMTVVGWRHPAMGRVHAHEDRCDRQGCVPVYALTSQGER